MSEALTRQAHVAMLRSKHPNTPEDLIDPRGNLFEGIFPQDVPSSAQSRHKPDLLHKAIGRSSTFASFDHAEQVPLGKVGRKMHVTGGGQTDAPGQVSRGRLPDVSPKHAPRAFNSAASASALLNGERKLGGGVGRVHLLQHRNVTERPRGVDDLPAMPMLDQQVSSLSQNGLGKRTLPKGATPGEACGGSGIRSMDPHMFALKPPCSASLKMLAVQSEPAPPAGQLQSANARPMQHLASSVRSSRKNTPLPLPPDVVAQERMAVKSSVATGAGAVAANLHARQTTPQQAQGMGMGMYVVPDGIHPAQPQRQQQRKVGIGGKNATLLVAGKPNGGTLNAVGIVQGQVEAWPPSAHSRDDGSKTATQKTAVAAAAAAMEAGECAEDPGELLDELIAGLWPDEEEEDSLFGW